MQNSIFNSFSIITNRQSSIRAILRGGGRDLFGISFYSNFFLISKNSRFPILRYMTGEGLKCPCAYINFSIEKWKCGNFDILEKPIFFLNPINLPEC